jgi:tRNA pseudouridine55 synthase
MDGILVVDKPKGITSHDVVLFVRRRFGEKKVGHTGILDPMATGVLILVLGRETRRANLLIDQDKEYQAILRLGVETSTQDREGKIISRKDTQHIQKDSVLEVLYSFRGQISQIPPMVSSRRYQGKRLYELARHGIEVERQPKNVWIYDLKVEWVHLPFVSFRLSCSKGTYVRTLCHDVGNVLGVGGHLYALQRTRSGSFALEDAVSWPGLSCMDHQDLKRNVLKYGLKPKLETADSFRSQLDESTKLGNVI